MEWNVDLLLEVGLVHCHAEWNAMQWNNAL